MNCAPVPTSCQSALHVGTIGMHKLSCIIDGEEVEHSFEPVFVVQAHGSANERILAGVPKSDPAVFRHLVATMHFPCYLLYLLHTPRGEGEPGRYQSQLLTWDEIGAFLSRFAGFLAKDARFDLWAHSPSERSTVVWDRHNHLFAYGATARFQVCLSELGFAPGEPKVPLPHAHNYHPQLDEDAAAVLQAFDWVHTPLRPADVQA
jgi:hypothetical protein